MDIQEILNHCETALKHHEKTLNKLKEKHDGSVETDKLIEYQIGRIISYKEIMSDIQFDENPPAVSEQCENGMGSKDVIEQAMYFINEDESLTTEVKSIAIKKLKEIRRIIVYSKNDSE